MSNTPRNNSSTSLMGFSVLQPSIGSPLQFFPAMGSKQLDEMIDAYVPGDASISDKRAAVSVEFFEHIVATGELFKFFMVYPSLGSATESPSGSMLDSGYGSSFTSPVMSENQWTHTINASFSQNQAKAGKSSAKKAAPSNDFSHLPGMKIITKDGQDVTNMTSRGCKTKEQRDHAHLMRIIKACDSCRRKKVRCDPSHKRSTGSSAAKVSKKTKKAAASTLPSSAPPPQQAFEPSEHLLHTPIDISDAAPSLSFDSIMPESSIDPAMDWSQFIQFDEEPTEAIPYDYDFFHDPQGFLSPTSYNSFSPSHPITPAQASVVENTINDTSEGVAQMPLPPYLNPGGEAGNDYADFNLYSPGSSTSMEDDLSLSKEVSAVPLPKYSEYTNHERLENSHSWEISTGEDQNLDTPSYAIPTAQHDTSSFRPGQILSPTGLSTPSYYESLSHTPYDNSRLPEQGPEWRVPVSPGGLSPLLPAKPAELYPQLHTVSSLAGADVSRAGEERFQAQSTTISSKQYGLQRRSSSSSTNTKLTMSNELGQQAQESQQRSVDILTSGTGAWSIANGTSRTPLLVTTESHEGGQPPQTVRHAEKRVCDEAVPKSSALEGYRKDATSLSPSPLSQSIRRTQFAKKTAEKDIALIAVTEAGARDTRSDSCFVNHFTHFTAQDIIISGANMQSKTLHGSTRSTSQLEAGSSMLRLGLLSALAVAALHVLSSLLAKIVVYQLLLSIGSAREVETAHVLAGYLFVSYAYTKRWQVAIKHVDMLDLSAEPLSLLRRLPFTVMNNAKSRTTLLSGCFSRINRNFEGQRGFQRFGSVQEMRHSQRLASLLWRW